MPHMTLEMKDWLKQHIRNPQAITRYADICLQATMVHHQKFIAENRSRTLPVSLVHLANAAMVDVVVENPMNQE